MLSTSLFMFALAITLLLVLVSSTHLQSGPVLPPRLASGDTVGIVCPAYPITQGEGKEGNWTKQTFTNHVEAGLAQIGLKVPLAIF